MKKEDLKTGMRVEDRNGEIKIVSVGISSDDAFINSRGIYIYMSSYSSDLINYNYNEFTIVKVYDAPEGRKVFNDLYKGELLWQRDETKELTMAELEKELGYKVKIKK